MDLTITTAATATATTALPPPLSLTNEGQGSSDTQPHAFHPTEYEVSPALAGSGSGQPAALDSPSQYFSHASQLASVSASSATGLHEDCSARQQTLQPLTSAFRPTSEGAGPPQRKQSLSLFQQRQQPHHHQQQQQQQQQQHVVASIGDLARLGPAGNYSQPLSTISGPNTSVAHLQGSSSRELQESSMPADSDANAGWSSRAPSRQLPVQSFGFNQTGAGGRGSQNAIGGSSQTGARASSNHVSGPQHYVQGSTRGYDQPPRNRANTSLRQPQPYVTDAEPMSIKNPHSSASGPSDSNADARRVAKASPQNDIMLGGGDGDIDTGRRFSRRSEETADGSNLENAPGLPGSLVSNANTTAAERDGQSRKQNSACDACRNRKVRCNRIPGEDRCAHCKSKGIECTTIYVQLATSGVKRPSKRQRTDGVQEATFDAQAGSEESFYVVKYLLLRDCDYSNHVQGISFPEQSRRMAPTTAAESRLNNATARQEFVSSLLETYFSTVHIRYPILDPHEFLQRFHYQSADLGGPPPDALVAVLLAWGAKFSTHPIILADRREAAHEELSPQQRQKRYAAHMGPARESSNRPRSRASSDGSSDFVRSIGRSRIAEELIVKAQEVLDRNKVHRVATMDNAKAALVIQALFWQQAAETELDNATLPAQLRARKRRGVYICNGVWVNCALSHMFEMKVHLQETVLIISDESQRNQIAMSWWLACMMDAHMSAFYRRKPVLSSEDYSTEPPAPPSSAPPGQAGPQPMAPDSGFRIWLDSALEQVEMMRSVYFTLFTPRAAREGISARKLESLASMAYRWRSNHLKTVGAPDPDWPVHWKFADAVTACSSDINYQIVWILMWQAIDEFGIAELKATNVSAYNLACLRHGSRASLPSTVAEMELDQSKIGGLRSAIYDEALKASLRSAHLSGMLCDFDYLQHEAGIMKFSLCEAGYCLTRFHRPEVQKIIKGLRQYGQAFEECYDMANELERLSAEYLHEGSGTMSNFDEEQNSAASPQQQQQQYGPVRPQRDAGVGGYQHSVRQASWEAPSLSGNDGRTLRAGSGSRRAPPLSSELNGPFADTPSASTDVGAWRHVRTSNAVPVLSGLNIEYADGLSGNPIPVEQPRANQPGDPTYAQNSQPQVYSHHPSHQQQQEQFQHQPPSQQQQQQQQLLKTQSRGQNFPSRTPSSLAAAGAFMNNHPNQGPMPTGPYRPHGVAVSGQGALGPSAASSLH